MPVFEVDLQISAHEDIEEIRDYLTREAPASVDQIINTIYDRMDDLSLFPYHCPVFQANPQFRRMVVEAYSVFYKVYEDQNLIRVYHVYHHARDTRNL